MPESPAIHRYTLTLCGGGSWNARTKQKVTEGFLMRVGGGYGCVHPWPALGDATVDEHLAAWRAGCPTSLVARALECAAADGAARRAGRSLFSGLTVPLSHATITGAADFPALAAEGFVAVKLKAGPDLSALSRRAADAAAAGLRVRLDANGILTPGEVRELSNLAHRSGWHHAVEFFEDPVAWSGEIWSRLAEETGWLLALDRWPENWSGPPGTLPAGAGLRVVKPAAEALVRWQTSVVVTSAMDHPLGQLFAAWEAARYPGEQREGGLLTHRLLTPDAFTERLGAAGPALTLPGGTGLGFDDLLAALPWEPLHRRVRLHVNPRAPTPAALPEIPAGCEGFFTSGSSGVPRLVILSERALDASAAAVNDWLGLTSADAWLRVLPDFHVGGAQIHRRATLTASRLVIDEEKWSALRFQQICERERITVTSLVPAQVHDLAAAKCEAPPCLRSVIVGGGALDPALWQAARALGWPLLPSYGLTETGSQVATARMQQAAADTFPALELLPGWTARILDPDTTGCGRLSLRGPGLCEGWHAWQDERWLWEPLPADGWLPTGDRARLEMHGRVIVLAGRIDRVVKVLGELVDLEAIEQFFNSRGLPPGSFAVEALSDARSGSALVFASEEPVPPDILAAWNASAPPFARITRTACLPLPRSPLGKLLRAGLRERLQQASLAQAVSPRSG